MSILIFFAVLFVLILVHELGHFLVAKWSGMRVDEFGIGFPPRIAGFKKGETEYTFNALPIGGFVRIFGEDGTNVPSSPVDSEAVDGRSEATAEAGQGGSPAMTEQSEAAEGGKNSDISSDHNRSFVSKNRFAQAAVLLAGVSMNIFFACLLFAIAFSFGIERAVEESAAGPNAKLIVAEVIADSPAAESGIPLGSTIISLQAGNETISNQLLPSTFSEFVSLHASEQITIKYRHNGEVNSVELYPAAGVIDNEPDKLAVGMALAMSEKVSESIPVAIWHAIKMTCTTLVAITVGIVGLLANAVQLKADLSAVAGPVGIVGLVGDAAEFGLISLMMFTAFISLNLAVINLLPFPALDGGRLLFVAIEGIIRRPINSVWVARVNLAGFAFLLLLMLAVTYNDILRIL